MSDERQLKRQRSLDQLKLNKLKEAVTWKDTFGTEKGKECLALLRKHYYDIEFIAHNDPTITQNRAAQRDLVRYIISQVEYTGESE